MSIADKVIFLVFILFIPFLSEVYVHLFPVFTLFHHMPYPSFHFIPHDKKDSAPYRAKSLALPPDFTYRKIRISFSDTDISYPFLRRAPVGYYSPIKVSLHLSKVHSTKTVLWKSHQSSTLFENMLKFTLPCP